LSQALIRSIIAAIPGWARTALFFTVFARAPLTGARFGALLDFAVPLAFVRLAALPDRLFVAFGVVPRAIASLLSSDDSEASGAVL
jgi:hypothetical protein